MPELLADPLRAEAGPLGGEAHRLALETAQLTVELLEARALDLRGALGAGHRSGVRFPALLPFLQCLLARLERARGIVLGPLRGGALGTQGRKLRAHRGELGLIALDVRTELRVCRLCLC